jgi:excisionase family DNA binding protein
LKKEAYNKAHKNRIDTEIDNRLCITIPEAAQMLGISRNHAYKLRIRGLLPIIKLGRRYLVPKVALDKMLADCYRVREN